MGTKGVSLDSAENERARPAGSRRPCSAAAVIAAGGTGMRMHAGIPKQFLEIAGKPVLLHTVERIALVEEVTEIVIALPPEHIPAISELLASHPMRPEIRCVAGGPTRQASVHNGIAGIASNPGIIMVHDAARPICERELIRRVLAAAWNKGAAIPGLPATDTIQRISRTGRVLATPPREELYAIQTPQAFHSEMLRAALDKAQQAGFLGTDESSVVRWAGHAVYVVPGSPDNLKITRPLDMQIAEILMSEKDRKDKVEMKGPKLRIGQGIDYHRLVEGRKLILGGVDIPFERGLEGHSDADALSHAVCDAILGAAAMGDIGRHFPDTDPAHRGRSSLEFLQKVREKVEAAGWMICNVDTTLLVQRPRIAPHAEAMKQNIAEALQLPLEAVSIKATTTEGLNAEGRGEGISAQAIALLESRENT